MYFVTSYFVTNIFCNIVQKDVPIVGWAEETSKSKYNEKTSRRKMAYIKLSEKKKNPNIKKKHHIGRRSIKSS